MEAPLYMDKMKLQEETRRQNYTRQLCKNFINLTIFGEVMFVGNMTTMDVERYTLRCFLWIMKAKLVHSSSRSLEFKLVSRSSFHCVHCIAHWGIHLQKKV